MTTLRTRRTYDHRIREVICETGDPDLFPELKIPRSTIRNWFRRQLDRERLPEGNGKRALLRAIERASRGVPLSVALRIARLAKAAPPCLPSQAQGGDSCQHLVGFSQAIAGASTTTGVLHDDAPR